MARKFQPGPDREQTFAVGEFTLSRPTPGKVWLTNAEGEGMETTEEKLAEALEEFFDAEF